MFDFSINVSTIVTIVVLAVGVVIWLVRLEGKADTNKRDVSTLSDTLGALQALVALHQQQFVQYRLDAAERYVTRETVSEIKRDVIDEINKMERRVEQTIDRAFKTAAGN
jgi:hypothetical protein